MNELSVLVGDALTTLRALPAERYHTVVTSPPYWGLRDYGVDGQLGRERTPEEVRGPDGRGLRRGAARPAQGRHPLAQHRGRLLRLQGGAPGAGRADERSLAGQERGPDAQPDHDRPRAQAQGPRGHALAPRLRPAGGRLVPAAGDHLVQAEPLPESVTDRPARAHEQVFLLSRSPRYFYDAVAVAEPLRHPEASTPDDLSRAFSRRRKTVPAPSQGPAAVQGAAPATRNQRSVWEIATQPYKGAHFATFPAELARRCIAAGTSQRGCCAACGAPWERQVERRFVPQADVSPERGRRGAAGQKPLDASNRNDGYPRGTTEVTTTGWAPRCACAAPTVPCRVLDPFGGAGTTALVARRLGRTATLIELSPEYADLARRRITEDAPLLNQVA